MMRAFSLSIFLLVFQFSLCAKEPVIFAVSLDAPQDKNAQIIEPTLNTLRNKFGDNNLKVVRLPLPELEKQLEAGKIDIFLSTSGLSRRMAQKGSKELVTMTSDRLPNPNEAYGTLFITRNDSSINTIADMKNKRLAANLKGGFYGYQIGMGELAKNGYNPSDFFSRIDFVGRDLRKVVESVIKGNADVGSVSSCFLEDTYPPESPIWKEIKPIGLKKSDGCWVSTSLYPNWSVSTMPTTAASVAKDVTVALLGMPAAEGGIGWSVCTDSQKTDELFKTLQLGPFSFLKDWFTQEFKNRYAIWIFFGLTLLSFFAATSVILGKLVRRRTRSLYQSLEAQRELQKKARAASEKVYALEKLGIVNQISSIVVHELRQPFTTIKAFIFGAKRKAEKNTLTNEEMAEVLSKIQRQSDRAEAIVDSVRNYAKQRNRQIQFFSFVDAVDSAVCNFIDCGIFNGKIETRYDCDLQVCGSPLEVELVVGNLLKNASDSLKSIHRKKPFITVRVFKANGYAYVEVSDNGGGTKTSEEILKSEKSDGLGLGLVIVKSIAEAHGRKFALQLNTSGAKAIFTIPLSGEDNEAEN